MMNGLSNKYVLILINGRKLTGDTSNNIDLSRIDRWNFQEMIAKAGYSCKEDLIAAALESKLIVTTLK